MTTVILSSGETFNAAWAAEAFNMFSARILDSDIISVVTAFSDVDSITVQTDGLEDTTYYDYRYVDTVRVYSDGEIAIIMRKEA